MISNKEVVLDGKTKHGIDVCHQSIKENYEVNVVLDSHTVIYPGAMVVETLNASITNSTVF